MDPVKITWALEDQVSGGLEKIGLTSQNSGEKAQRAVDDVNRQVREQATAIQKVVSELENHLEKLQKEPITPDVDQSESIAQINALKKTIEELRAEIERTKQEFPALWESAKQPITPPDLQNVQRKFNGLNMSIQQITRELPSLAMGPQMFFLAISNNLPIFTDELSKARKEYDTMIASGQKGIPVWKQLLSSILSWQTAMTVGILLLVTYGKEIGEWVGELFRVNKALTMNIETMKEFQSMVAKSSGPTVATLERLSESWKRLGGDIKAQEQFILSNRAAIESMGVSVTNAEEAERIFNSNKNDFILSLLERAKAASAMELASEQYKKAVEKMMEADQMVETRTISHTTSAVMGGSTQTVTLKNWDKIYAQNEADELFKKGTNFVTKYTQFNEQQQQHLASIGIKTNETINEIEAGSVAALEEAISLKQKALKKISNREDYIRKKDEIKELQKQLYSITGDDESRKNAEAEATELSRLELEAYRKLEDQKVKLIHDQFDRREEEARLQFEREKERITQQEQERFELLSKQKNVPPKKRANVLVESELMRNNALLLYKKEMDGIAEARSKLETPDQKQEREQREKFTKLYHQYKGFDAKRRDLEKHYNDDVALLEKNRTEQNSADIDAAIQKRGEAYQSELNGLQDEILKTTDFYQRLFENMSKKGYKTLSDFSRQANEVLNSATQRKGVDGRTYVDVKIPTLDDSGKVIQKQVSMTLEEFNRLKEKSVEIGTLLEKKNPFLALSNGFKHLKEGVDGKDSGKIADAIEEIDVAATNVITTMDQWGDSLGKIFGEGVGDAFKQITHLAGGVKDLGVGIGKIATGDITGGITSALSGLSAIFTTLFSWREKYEAYLRKQYLAEVETNRMLRERNYLLQESSRYMQAFINDQRLLNELIEKGYIQAGKRDPWSTIVQQFSTANENLKAELTQSDKLLKQLSGESWDTGWVQTGSLQWSRQSGNIGGMIQGQTEEQMRATLALLDEQDKLKGAAKEYYENWKKSGETIEELIKNVSSLRDQMRELVTGMSFDSFLDNVANALMEAKGDIKKFASFTEETLRNSLLNSFKYQILAEAIQPFYEELSNKLIDDRSGLTNQWITDYMSRLNGEMTDQWKILNGIFQTAGISPDGSTTQTGRAGVYTTITQEQGTKLEGLYTASQVHLSSIDELMENIVDQIDIVLGVLAKIEENTAYCRHLEQIRNDISTIKRDGLKMK